MLRRLRICWLATASHQIPAGPLGSSCQTALPWSTENRTACCPHALESAWCTRARSAPNSPIALQDPTVVDPSSMCRTPSNTAQTCDPGTIWQEPATTQDLAALKHCDGHQKHGHGAHCRERTHEAELFVHKVTPRPVWQAHSRHQCSNWTLNDDVGCALPLDTVQEQHKVGNWHVPATAVS